MLVNSLNQKSNQKLKYEEIILEELQKQLSTNKYCVQLNKQISKIKIKINELVLFILIICIYMHT